MIDRLPILAVLLLASLPAAAANNATRNYGVSGFDRIRVDGPYEVHLKTGVAPYARASAANGAALDSVSIRVEGRTLVIRKGSGNWGGYTGENNGPVVIDIGTHELNTAWLNGAGSLNIDKVKGLSFDLGVMGAGNVRIDSVSVDQFKVSIAGAGTARLQGQALSAAATIRGSSLLDAGSLTVKDAVIGAEGPSLVRLNTTNTLKVDAVGLATVQLTGNPACTVKTQGSATVSGCKASAWK